MKRAAVGKIRITEVWLQHRRLSERVGRTIDLDAVRLRKALRVERCGNSVQSVLRSRVQRPVAGLQN